MLKNNTDLEKKDYSHISTVFVELTDYFYFLRIEENAVINSNDLTVTAAGVVGNGVNAKTITKEV